MRRFVIFNADDFGASDGINRGIIDCHLRGVVTSASLMVTGRAVDEAAAMSRDHPGLAVGLHWDVCGEDDLTFDTGDEAAVGGEFRRQLDEFIRLMDRLPTHIDSHKEVHKRPNVEATFRGLVEPLGVPLRGDGGVKHNGKFYAQWKLGVTELQYVSVPFLKLLLRDEVRDGWNEFSCHPGYGSRDFSSIYHHERIAELRTLTDPSIRESIETLGYTLASFADYNARADNRPTAE